MSIIALIIRVSFSITAIHGAAPITDTHVFFSMAASPFFSAELLAGARPPLVPVIYKLLGCSTPAIIIFQTLFASVAWCFLALSISRSITSTALRYLAFILLILVSFSEPVIVWESALISESISTSLFICMIAALVNYIRKQSVFRVAALTSFALAWIFTRETNLWMTLLVIPLIAWYAVRFSNRQLAALFLVLLAGCIICSLSSSKGKRWLFPLLNVVSKRILTSEHATAYFVKHGMPFSDTLATMRGECASCKEYRYYNNDNLKPFMKWMLDNGKPVYMKWLISHPAASLREPLANVELLVAPGSEYHYASPSSKRILPALLSKFLFPVGYEHYFSLLLLWMLVFFTGISIGARTWRFSKVWQVITLLSIYLYPHLFIVWHGDVVGFEMGRHALGIRIQINIALWMMVIFTIDMMIRKKLMFMIPKLISPYFLRKAHSCKAFALHPGDENHAAPDIVKNSHILPTCSGVPEKSKPGGAS